MILTSSLETTLRLSSRLTCSLELHLEDHHGLFYEADEIYEILMDLPKVFSIE